MDKYSVYQLKKTDEGMKLLHLTFNEVGSQINAGNYEKVWDGEVEGEQPWKIVAAELGKDLPAGFYGHMITVSDVIVINGTDAYYVDATGYKKLPSDFTSNLKD